MSQPCRAVPASRDPLGNFRNLKDGVYRIPGGDVPSVEFSLREQGTKIEVVHVETGHIFHQEWMRTDMRRIYFSFMPPKRHRFPDRMNGDRRRLAAAIQRYILDAYTGEDLSAWKYPRKKEKTGFRPDLLVPGMSTVSA